MEDVQGSYTKNHTLCTKGIAVLMLCWHHLFWHNVDLPMDLSNTYYMDVLTVITKVCVATFTILSGYGISESYRRKGGGTFRFAIQHVWKLLKNFWWVYVPAFVLSFAFHFQGTPLEIYGGGILGVRNFLLDFFGVRALIYSPTLNNTWWYIEAALVFYMLYPVLLYLVKKLPVILLIVTSIPVILASGGVIWEPLITTDRELFYIMPFVIGMLFSEYHVLNRIVAYSEKRRWIFAAGAIIFCITSALLRTMAPMITDVIYAISIIFLGIAVCNVAGKVKNIFAFLGECSMDIYLIHSFIYYYFVPTRELLGGISNYVLRYIVLVLISLALSFVLMQLKKIIEIGLRRRKKSESEAVIV